MKHLHLYLSVIGLIACTIQVAGQDQRPAKEDEIKVPFLAVLQTQVLIPRMGHQKWNTKTVRGYQIADPIEDIAILRTKDVFAELEFVDEQSSKIKKVLKASDDLRKKVREKLVGVKSRDGFKKLVEWHQSEGKKITTELDDVLLPHQRDLVRRIGDDFHLRRVGLQAFLKSLEGEDDFSVSKAEWKKLSKQSASELASIAEKGKKSVRQSIEELLKPLDSAKRERIDIERFIGDGISSVDTLIAQLAFKAGAVRKINSPFDSLERPAIYMPDDDGSPMFYVRGGPRVSCDFERITGYESLLDCLSEGGMKGVNLDESQAQQISQVRQKLSDKCIEMDIYMSSSLNPWIASENVLDMQIGLTKGMNKDLHTILAPTQIEALKKGITEFSPGKFGLLYELTEGSLKEALEVSQSEIEALQKSAPKIREKIQKETRSWVRDYNRKLITVLSVQNQKAVKKHWGKTLDVGGAALFVLPVVPMENQ